MPKSKGGKRRAHAHSRKCSHKRRRSTKRYSTKRRSSRGWFSGGMQPALSPLSLNGGGSPASLSPATFSGGGAPSALSPATFSGGGSPAPWSPDSYASSSSSGKQSGGSGGDGKGGAYMQPHGVSNSTDSTSLGTGSLVSKAMSGGGGRYQQGGFLGPALVPFGLLGAQKLYQNSRGTQRRFKRFPGSVKRSLNRYF